MSSNPPGYMKKYRAKNGKENYKKYQGTPKALKECAMRHAARKEMWLKKWDPREVDHKNGNPMQNNKKNLRAISRTLNRRLGWASPKRTDWKLN